jgi:hypothetical protein
MSRPALEAERAVVPAELEHRSGPPEPEGSHEILPFGPTPRRRDGSWLWITGIGGGSFAYATLRYNVFKGVPWTDWPAYTLNKALAFAALALIALAMFRLAARRSTGTILAAGGAFGLVHSLLSFALLDPVYYPRLYDSGKLTFLAGLSLTLGAAAAAAMDIGARKSGSWRPNQRHAALAAIAFGIGLHAALPAFSTWIVPATWPGSLPPITLLSFAVGTLAAAGWIRGRA